MPESTGLTPDHVADATVVVPIDAVRPHPRNPNRRGNVAAIRESLRASCLDARATCRQFRDHTGATEA